MTCCSTTSGSWTTCASPLRSLREKHPKVASRLVLEPTKCEDPHVERLLEAFAFLAARVHLKMEDEFPEITEGLLTVVYPQLVRPLPSMSVVEFQLDPEKGKLTSGLKIERHTPLYSKPIAGVPCTFRTCYDTTLWPMTVAAAELRAPSRLQAGGEDQRFGVGRPCGASLRARRHLPALKAGQAPLLPRWRERPGQHPLRVALQPPEPHCGSRSYRRLTAAPGHSAGLRPPRCRVRCR